MKKLLASVIVLAGASLAVPAFAADSTSPGGSSAAGDAQHGQMQGAQSTLSKSDLVGRKVVDSNGKQVGQVKDVITDPQGAPLNVIVATSKKDVSLTPDEIKMASNDTLKANKTAKEINQLPAALPSSTSPDSSAPTGSTSPMNGTGTAPGSTGGASGGAGTGSAPNAPY